MILNEDFFNDVEIKDEDLTAEEPVEEPVEEYNEKTSRELIENKISESEMVLMIYIDLDQFHGEFDIWHRIKHIMKRLKYLFNIYNINISEPFISYSSISLKILKYKEYPVDYTLIQHKGCNLYFHEDEFREYGPDIIDGDLELFVFLDKKLPVFKTARGAYNFASSLDKCLWKDITNHQYHDCFRWCNLYDINDVYISTPGIIKTYSDNNSYVNNDGTWIYRSVLDIVPEELVEQLRNIVHSKFANKILTKDDVNTIIKLAEQ